jgi:formate dehydrogenase major subunit
MVNVNIFDNETGSFWRGPGMDPTQIKTEVFFLPAAVSVEKEGSITNSGRWSQWRYQGPRPMGNSRPDGQIIMDLGNKIKDPYRDGGIFPEPIRNLKWDYLTKGRYDPHAVAKEINGYFLKDVTVRGKTFKKGTLVPSFAYLQSDGSTSSGNWLYCNSYTEKGNMAARRSTKDASNNIGLYPEFAWCWPVNRRIIDNRASVDLQGQPWDKSHWVIKWDGAKWSGGDVPDGGWPPIGSFENPNPKSRHAFIMRKHGHGQIFGPGRADGPLPEHYEPMECPVEKNYMNASYTNPTAPTYGTKADVYMTCDPRYPYVGTTYRVVEHWQSGVMTRNQPWLLELQPQVFVEISEELAALKGLKNGERVLATSARGKLECTAIVTKRMQPPILTNWLECMRRSSMGGCGGCFFRTNAAIVSKHPAWRPPQNRLPFFMMSLPEQWFTQRQLNLWMRMRSSNPARITFRARPSMVPWPNVICASIELPPGCNRPVSKPARRGP